MNDLTYSNEALNVKNLFYQADGIVYVEGDDDLIFWHEVFARVPNVAMEIEALGSCTAVDNMIELIEQGQVTAIAARDSDYTHYKNSSSTSSRVLYTDGYSIENTLINEESALSAARTFCKNPKLDRSIIRKWFKDTGEIMRELIELDLASSIAGSSAIVLGDNSSRFTVTQDSATLCRKKCAAQAVAIKRHLAKAKISEAKSFLKDEAMEKVLRGHFLFSHLRKFLSELCKNTGKKVSLSYDALYSFLISHFMRMLDCHLSNEYRYVTRASLAVASFTT